MKIIGEKIEFANANDMLCFIKNEADLYNTKTGEYIFEYNESGSIASYFLDESEAVELQKKSIETGEYWGAFLGFGGYIYDDPSYEYYSENNQSNYQYCEKIFNSKDWIKVPIICNEQKEVFKC